MTDHTTHDGDTAVTNRRPSLVAYQVRDGKDDASYWDRIGVAWSPTNKLTLRMGGGIFYSQDVANSYFDLTRNAAGRRDSFTNPDFPDLTWDHPFGASKCGQCVH